MFEKFVALLWDNPYFLARPLAEAKAETFDVDDVIYAVLFSIYGNLFTPREEQAVLRIMEVRCASSPAELRAARAPLTPPRPSRGDGRGCSTCCKSALSAPSRRRRGCGRTRCLRACSPSTRGWHCVGNERARRGAHWHPGALTPLGRMNPLRRNFANGRMYLKAALQDPVLAVLEDDLLNLEIDPVKVRRAHNFMDPDRTRPPLKHRSPRELSRPLGLPKLELQGAADDGPRRRAWAGGRQRPRQPPRHETAPEPGYGPHAHPPCGPPTAL